MSMKNMKKDWMFILSNMGRQDRWTKEERKIPITQSHWFSGLILHSIDFRSKKAGDEHAFVVFGHLCHYLLRSYSIKPAADILTSLERNENRVFNVPNKGDAYIDPETGVTQVKGFYKQNPNNILDLIRNIVSTGYNRCGTSTVFPFAYWLSSCGVDLVNIRELLVVDLNKTEQEKIKDLTEEIITDKNVTFKKEESDNEEE